MEMSTRPNNDNRESSVALLKDSVESIREQQFPSIPSSLVATIVELELTHDHNPQGALTDIELAVSKVSRAYKGNS